MQENKQETSSIRRHRPFYKLPLFWIILVAVLLGGALIAQRVIAAKKKSSASDSSTESSVQVPNNAKSSEESAATTQKSNAAQTDSPDKTPSQYDGEDPNRSASLTGFLSTARFDGDKLVLRLTIDQYLAEGICKLTLTDDAGHSLQKSASLTPVASTSSCEGFDVAGSELSDFVRPIYITVDLASGDKVGVVEGSVE